MATITLLPLATTAVKFSPFTPTGPGGPVPNVVMTPNGSADLATCWQTASDGKYGETTTTNNPAGGGEAAWSSYGAVFDASGIPLGSFITSVTINIRHQLATTGTAVPNPGVSLWYGAPPLMIGNPFGNEALGDIVPNFSYQVDSNVSPLTTNAVTGLPFTLNDLVTLTFGFLFEANYSGPGSANVFTYDVDLLSLTVVYSSTPSPTVQIDQLVTEILIDYDIARAAGLPAGQVYVPLATAAGSPNGLLSTLLWPSITQNPFIGTGGFPGVPLSLLALQPADDGWSTPTGESGIPGSSACYPLETAVEDLAARLQDPGMVHWTSAELTRYLVEALRTYNAYTQFYRNRDTFLGSTGAPFYDLPTVIPALRAYTVTDRDLVTDMEYALMEPPTPTVWTGTSMFTLGDLTGAIQRRRDQFLRETGAVVTRAVLVVTPDAAGRFTLPSNILTIRRMAWIMADGTVIPLTRDDEWGLTHYDVTWQTPVDPTQTWPTVYSVGVTPPLTVQLGPPPANSGSIEILAIMLGGPIDPTGPNLLGVPDDWAWVVKWGALADVFNIQGTAFDPTRAAHCQARWELGIKLATQAAVLLAAYVNSLVTQTYSVADADSYLPTWETTPGPPTKVLTTAQNLLGLAPPPDGLSYVVTVDVVANVPVPVNPTDCVNLGIDDSVLDAIYDYAQYLALVKEGPGPLDQATGLYQRFAAVCGVTTALDQASVPTRGPILQQTVQDVRVKARTIAPEETTS